MIAHLRGTVHRLSPTEVTVDVQGVGYKVTVPPNAWEELQEGQPCMLWISPYIREDRFDLFGFPTKAGKDLFEQLTSIAGIGPKIGVELCAATRVLAEAVSEDDPSSSPVSKGSAKRPQRNFSWNSKRWRRRSRVFSDPQALAIVTNMIVMPSQP